MNTLRTTGTVEGKSEHETVIFRDGAPQWTVEIPSGYEDTRKQGMRDQLSLDDFFRRPVQVDLGDWTPGSASPFGYSMNPWAVFWNNKRNINRITANKLLQCTMKVKIMINGNPFLYGRLLADYVPLQAFNTIDTINTLNKNTIVQASQRLHFYINPTTSQGGEMSLPFITPYNAMDIVAANWSDMGTLYIRELNSLKHANGGLTPISLSAYIWAENVEFSVPTTQNAGTLVTQSDEYGSRPVSATATAVAAAAGKLVSLPMIGPYAKATQMAASGMATVAKAFGFSRPPMIEDSTQVRPKLITRLANTDCGDAVAKLTVDSKQELTVDPRIFGASTQDDLTIANIATRESYFSTFDWPIATPQESLLWNTRVGPFPAVLDSTLTVPGYWMTAPAFTSLPFAYWRGTMRYRIQIVCSEYHRGRIKVVYDPNFVSTIPESNVGFTRIVDISDEKDFVVDVSMAQTTSYLPTVGLASGAASYGPARISTTSAGYNGTLAIFVQNELTSPNSTVNNSVQVNVFVSACDDIEYAVPSGDLVNTLTYSLQSDEKDIVPDENAPDINDTDLGVLSCNPVDHTNDVFFGESIRSFRTLLKRYTYLHSILCPTPGTNRWAMNLKDFPYYRGRWANGINTDSTAAKANFVNTILLTYLTPAFLGVRGSVRWKNAYASDQDNSLMYSIVTRLNTIFAFTNVSVPYVTTSGDKFVADRVNGIDSLFNGADVTYNKAQPVLEYELPYYSRYRFMAAKDPSSTSFAPSVVNNLTHQLQIGNTSTALSYVDRYVSVGEDFQLFLYQGPPPIHQYLVTSA